MDFLISAKTDIGNTKKINQDSVSVKVINTRLGRIVMAVLCDGMGGYSKGEAASASVIRAFDAWTKTELPKLCSAGIDDQTIRNQWERLIIDQNTAIYEYGRKNGCKLGTTVVAMLITNYRYYVLNIGDSRAYVITDRLVQITNDHSLVAREVQLGRITEEESEKDNRRSTLLKCVGITDEVYPDIFFGSVKSGVVFMLCSDGFRHEITKKEIFDSLKPQELTDEKTMDEQLVQMIELNKKRRERDNITVAVIKTV